ncbi:MAG: pectin acetylesterase-family hydrolase [Acidimicrobiales bacterium]
MTDPLDRPGRNELIEGLEAIATPDAPPMAELRRRRRNRRVRRRGGALVVALAVVGGLAVALPASETEVETAAFPEGLLTLPSAAVAVDDDGAGVAGSAAWTWRPADSLQARDGSTTGVALRRNAESSDVLVYLLDGGICLDAETCDRHDADYDAEDFARDTAEGGLLSQGVFDVDEGYFRDWNVVAIPNANGDLHLGRSADPAAAGDATQHFVGAQNVARVLRSIAGQEDARVDRVLLAGSGAGGLGVYGTIGRLREIFPTTEIAALIDGAPLPGSARLPSMCLAEQWDARWNLGPPDRWIAPVPPATIGFSAFYAQLADRHPDVRFGLAATRVPGRLAEVLAAEPAACDPLGDDATAQWPSLIDALGPDVDALLNWSVATFDRAEPVLAAPLDDADTGRLHAVLDELLETP